MNQLLELRDPFAFSPSPSPLPSDPAVDITDSSTSIRRHAYQRIAENIRREILTGKFLPGAQLPPTGKLATQWRSSNCTIQAALVMLVREGWVQRLNGAGTYVADVKNRFTCMAIYHGIDVCSNELPAYNRSIHAAFLRQAERMGKEVQVFIDSRPFAEQRTVLPALADAILHRRVQCLVIATGNQVNSPALAKLPLPTVFASRPKASQHRVNFDVTGLIPESMRRLADQGCRSAGLITNVPWSAQEPDVKNPRPHGFRNPFMDAARSQNLATRDEWICMPPDTILNLPQFGYEQFLQFWQLPEKPDGLVVYADEVARGVVTAILEIGMRAVTDRMKFVFHRNAGIDFICPFRVTWAISDEDRLAERAMESIQKQFRGEAVSAIQVPHLFQEHEPGRPLRIQSSLSDRSGGKDRQKGHKKGTGIFSSGK